MIYRIVDIVLWIIASGLIGYLFAKNMDLKKKLNQVLKREPTELDLELATLPQLFNELKKRPISYLMLLPKWKVTEEEKTYALGALQVVGCNIPDEAASEMCRAASELISQGQGEFNCGDGDEC